MNKMRMVRYALAALLLGGALEVHAGAVLDQVKSSNALTCGIVTDEADYSKADTHGNLAALGADFCKAVAVAVLGKDAKIIANAFPDEPHGLQAVQSGAVALLAGATPSLWNAATWSVGFGPPLFYDGQAFLVMNGIASLKDLAGKQVCFIDGSDADERLQPQLAARGIAYIPFPFQEDGEMQMALFTHHCQAMTGDLSRLAAMRASFRGRAREFAILPETIAKDPLAPAYRRDDPAWAAIVDWTVRALIQAEESEVTQANVEKMMGSDDPDTMRLLGTRKGVGKALGLDDDWAVRVIKAVGNYGEIYARDLGENSPLKLPRGANALWTKGGLMYAEPLGRMD